MPLLCSKYFVLGNRLPPNLRLNGVILLLHVAVTGNSECIHLAVGLLFIHIPDAFVREWQKDGLSKAPHPLCKVE